MTDFASSGPLAVGQTLGPRYRIMRLLGSGGMGAVYQAWDAELGVAVAVKVIRPEAITDAAAAQEVERRFKRELLLARQVTHRNVVRIHDLGEVDGIKYLTMPYVEGSTLAGMLRREGQLPAARVIAIARQVVAGLAAAHEASVVHRDIKPENIMVTPDGTALIMDFGISRSLSGGTAGTGAFIGTLEYMAPEQASSHEVDHRADIYSLGLIMYDLMSGRRRIAVGDNPMSEFVARTKSAPAPLRSLAPEVPPAVERVVMRCIQSAPEDRYQSAAELAQALAALAGIEATGAPRKTAVKRLAAITGIAALLVLAALTAWKNRLTPATTLAATPVSVVVANIANRTNDPLFDGLIEPTLSVGLEGAPFISLYPRRDALRALAAIKPGAELDEQGARLLALREGVQRVIAGEVAAAGNGFVLNTRIVDPSSGTVLSSSSTSARDKQDMLNSVARAGARIRKALGDRTINEENMSAAETFTAASLEAASAYARGQELRIAGRYDEAIAAYRDALTLDPRMGRAYAGLGAVYNGLGRLVEAREAVDQALRHIDRMTEREKYRTRGVHYMLAGNNRKAREEFESLVRLYPLDNAGLSNLALAYFDDRDFARAIEYGARAAKLFPNNVVPRNNYAWYALYAGNFRMAREQALAVRELNAGFGKAYVVGALAQMADGDADSAAATYGALERLPAGKDLGTYGPADLALYGGRLNDAAAILSEAMKRGAESTSRTARLTLLLAETRAAQGASAEASALADRVLSATDRAPDQFMAGRVLLASREVVRAEKVAAALVARSDDASRHYGALLHGEIQLARNDARGAIATFESAQRLTDSWLGRLDLAQAFVAAGMYPESDAELDLCIKRRGEVTAAFLDDVPTYRLFAPVLYYVARTREGLKSPGATDAYREFLRIKQKGTEQGLVTDAKKRLAALERAPSR